MIHNASKVLNQYIIDNKVDGALLYTPINRYWYLQKQSSAGLLFQDKNKRSVLYIDARYFEAFKNLKTVDEVVLMKSLPEVIADVKKRFKFKSIIIEDNLTLAEYARVIKPFELKTVEIKFQSLRAVKTKDEIINLQKAADIACAGIEYVKKLLKVGVTEKFIAKELLKFYLDNGATGPSFDPIVAFGKNSAIPHHSPTDTKLLKNDVVLIDTGCLYNGYCSDITRTFAFGKPSEEFVNAYNVVAKAQLLGIEKANVKVTGGFVDKFVREIIDNSIYHGKFTHGTGHGVGIEIHELPNVAPNQELLLKDGSIVTIEPGVYLSGKFGIRIEDTILVQKSGVTVLTRKSPKKLLSV